MSKVMAQDWSLKTLLQDLRHHGDQPAVQWVRGEDVETWSYRSIADLAGRLACGLIEAGVEKGQPIALFGPNRPEWIVCRLGLGAAGAVAVPIDEQSSAREAASLLKDSGARHVFVGRQQVPRLQDAIEADTLGVYLLDDGREAALPSWRDLLATQADEVPPVPADAPMTLVYTSGTTGAPKSFILTYDNVWANVRAMVAERLIGPDDRLLLPLPLHHIYPIVVGLLTPLVSGATVVLPQSATGAAIVDALHRGRCTGLFGVPRLYTALVGALRGRVAGKGAGAAWLFSRLLQQSVALRRRYDWHVGRTLFRPLHRQFAPELRLLISGGARLEPEVLWTMVGLGWDVRSGYGLAETASIFTGNLPGGRERLGSEGRPFQGGELRIHQPDATGLGEIQLRGPNVFSGYRDNPEANELAFTEDGWFRTGDLGRRDEDGFLYVAGRIKEMIVLGGGKNIYPEELERVYADSPFIEEAAVLERNGALVALVRPDLAAIRDSGYGNLRDTVRVSLGSAARELPPFQRLAGFAMVREALPRTRLGKYQRFKLPELYDQAEQGGATGARVELSEEDKALLQRSPAAEIWALLRERYPDKPVNLDANPQLDLGIDSLEWMTLSLTLQDRMGLALPDDAVAEVTSLRDLLQLAQQQAEDETAPHDAEGAQLRLSAEDQRFLAPPGPLGRLGGRLLYGANRAAVRSYLGLDVEGEDWLPGQSPFIVVANHVSDLDPLVLAAALPYQRLQHIHWGGVARRLFGTRAQRAVARALNVFPVDERATARTLAFAVEVLKRGEALIWFPEAWRSPDGALQPFRPGIGRLVLETGAPVVPAFIDGTFEAMPRDRRLPRRHHVSIRFGQPIAAERLRAMANGDRAHEQIAEALRDLVQDLKPTA